MYIDFHTHAYADKIVERAMSKISGNSDIKPATNGTLEGLKNKMNECGIDKAVLLPIATKPSQQTIINNWAKDVSSQNIISFGSVHQDAEDVMEELERIKALGLYGVKFHPDYQGFCVDEKKYFPIYRKCAELKLPVIFHAGFDPVSPENTHGMPAAFARVNDAIPEMTMILAHLGGMYRWDMVERYLAGRSIYFDTGVIAGEIGKLQLQRIIKKHGCDKILFASDCPWDDPKNEIDMIKSLSISEEDKEKIFHKNAEKLLGL